MPLSKTEWAAIAGSAATIITALLASLGGLGEHAPGVVTGLLIATPVLLFAFSIERQIQVYMSEGKQREDAYAALLRDRITMDQQLLAAVNHLCELHSIEARIANLELNAKKSGGDHDENEFESAGGRVQRKSREYDNQAQGPERSA